MPTSSARPRVRPGLLTCSVAAALSVTLAGCSSDETTPEPTTSAPASSISSSAPASSAASTSRATSTSAERSAATPEPSAPGAGPATKTSAPRSATTSAGAPAAGQAAKMSCRAFRELDDAARAAAVTSLGVKDNAEQVAMVVAVTCLSRPDDKVSDVVDELVAGR
ncbi:hypothetical protein ACN93_09035 [Gordonia paraffinivorans]|uniref:hypothetical protein n=1 Tax=Gordonia paraffinivorans TaxID=175628 RepID=UPI000D60DF99|nr:hypothetical protein [Gordonia paraffinivorans]PWD43376.1 hypothetical protein ACN93_09035 [Gordonia paraffinivorans]